MSRARLALVPTSLLVLLLAGAGCGSSSAPADTTPQVTPLTRAGMPAAVGGCYDGASSFASDVAAVNNDGVVAANVLANPTQGCPMHGYLWDAAAAQVTVLPFATPDPGTLVVGARLSVLSTNRVSGGITFTAPPGSTHPDDRATLVEGLTSRIVHGYNYIFGVSENGAYLTGTNLGGIPLLLDRASFAPFNLTLGGEFLQGAMLNKVSNGGVAVGNWLPPGATETAALVCRTASVSCAWVLGGDLSGYSAFLQGISTSGAHVYGFVNDGVDVQLFSVDPATLAVTPLDPGYILGNLSPVTDDGALVVLDEEKGAHLLVPFADGTHAIYAATELASKLGLPVNVDPGTLQLSPNGSYAVLDVRAYGPNDLFAVRVYFPGGISGWARANLTPEPAVNGANPVIR